MPAAPEIIRTIDRPDKSLVAALGEFGVPTVHEANSRSGLMHGIRPVTGGKRIAGTAVTSLDFAGDNLMLNAALDAAAPGDVLVASVTAPSDHGMFGDLLATLCAQRGILGVVLAASARDVQEIRRAGFPVWAAGVSAAGTVKASPGWVNIPVSCGGTVVFPGDVVVADDDGVVVVSQCHCEQVLHAARAREAYEETLRGRFRSGESSLDTGNLRSLIDPYVRSEYTK